MPCAKNAFSLSELRFSNGNTATDLSSVAVGAVCFGDSILGDLRVRTNWNASSAAASTAAVTITAVHLLPGFRVFDSLGVTSSERRSPSGVSSNAHARIRATGKPRITAVTNTFITHGGASKVGKRIEAAWISSHATIA